MGPMRNILNKSICNRPILEPNEFILMLRDCLMKKQSLAADLMARIFSPIEISSKFEGVVWSKQKNLWQALVKIGDEIFDGGFFKNEVDAAL